MFEKWRPAEVTHVSGPSWWKRSISLSPTSLDDNDSETEVYFIFENKAIAMTSKLAVHQMKKTAQKTLLRVRVIGSAST